jgi:rod shape-determining protein MreB and related proteins
LRLAYPRDYKYPLSFALFGHGTAETVKMTIGNAYPDGNLERAEVKGRDLTNGVPRVLTIDSGEVREAISEQLSAISGAVLTALERMPPELSADLLDTGIVLAGGAALLKNMDLFLRSVIKLSVNIAEDPMTAVAVGAGKALEDLGILKGLEQDKTSLSC